MKISLDIVRLLVLLVDYSVLGSAGTGAQLSIIILGNLLVGFLRCLGTSSLNSLGNVVGGVLCMSVSPGKYY